MSIGIYKIISPNNKIYIGQSIDIERRFNEYKNKTHHTQPKLLNSLQKYGISTHTFSIIEICVIGDLNTRERYWQEYYNVLKDGLNCRLQNTNDKSGVDSYETKYRKSQSLLKPIIQYDIEGNFIRKWNSIKEAQTSLNISRISRSCLEKSKSVGGWIFRHETNPLPDNYIHPTHGNKGKIISLETREKMSKSGKGKPQPERFSIIKSKPVICYNLEGIELNTFNSISEASQMLDLDLSAISKCCRGVYKSTKKYKFKFK
jgi:group I intron endonuclease